MRKMQKKEGFTLVELSLSIVFIAVLSLSIVFVINNAVAVYRRGLILNQVNTIGMDLVDDFRATIQSSSPVSLTKLCGEVYGRECDSDAEKGLAAKLVANQRTGSVNLDGGLVNNIPIGGVFCTGSYSYIWNSGYFLSNTVAGATEGKVVGANALKLKYGVSGAGGGATTDTTAIRLIKIKDGGRAVCKKVIKNGDSYEDGFRVDENGVIDMSDDTSLGEPTELLASEVSMAGFALYDLYSTVPATNTTGNAALYSASFVLGTVQGGANITATGNFCRDSSTQESADYCAINKFNFAAQANGG